MVFSWRSVSSSSRKFWVIFVELFKFARNRRCSAVPSAATAATARSHAIFFGNLEGSFSSGMVVVSFERLEFFGVELRHVLVPSDDVRRQKNHHFQFRLRFLRVLERMAEYRDIPQHGEF